MADELKIILRAINQASGPIDDVRGSMTRLSGAAGDLHTRALLPLRNMLGTGLKVAAGAAVAVIGGLVATIGSSVGAAADMQQGIADISAAMGASTEETGKLKKLIENLGFDPQLKVTATEAAEAIGTLGTAGLSVDEILSGAARSTVLLANATGAQFGDAAGIASDVMSLFNIKAADMARAVDGITSTTIASKFNINDYRLALAQAGGVAATVGVGFDDFNTTIAAIAPFFASGSDAGTSFKTMLQRLIPQSNEAKGLMQQLGLITADGANAFFDASGSMKGMGEIAGILNKALGGLSEEQKNNALATIFGTDAMRAAAAMAGMTEQEFNDLKATMAKTDAEEAAAKRMDTFRGVMEILTGVVDTLKVQIGDAFLPVLRRLAELFTEQAQVHGPAIVEMFRGLAGQLEISLQKLLPWIEQALPRLIAQIPTIVANMIEFGKQFIAAATTVYNAVAPVVSFVAGLVDLKGILLVVGGLMAVSAVASVVSFVASIVGAISSVVSFVGAIGGVLGSLGGLGVALGGAGAAFTAILAAIGPVIVIVGAVGAAVAALYLAWQNNWFGIRDATQNALGWLRGALGDFPATLDGWRTAFFDRARSAMNRLGDAFREATAPIRDELRRTLNDIQERGVAEGLGLLAGRMYEKAREGMSRFLAGVNEAAPNLRNDMQRVLNAVIDVANAWSGGANNHLFSKARDLLQRMLDGLNSISLSGVFTGILDTMINGFNSKIDGFKTHVFNSASALGTRIRDGLTSVNLSGVFNGILDGMINGFNSKMDGFRNHVFGSASALGTRIRDGLTSVNLSGVMGEALQGIINGFNSIMDGFRNHVYSVMQGVGHRLMDGLRDGISSMMGSVLGKIQEITNLLPQWVKDQLGIHSPSTVFQGLGRNIMEGLVMGMQELAAAPQGVLAGVAASLTPGDNNGLSVGPSASSGAVNNNQRTTQNNFTVASGTSADADLMERVRVLNMLYGGAGV